MKVHTVSPWNGYRFTHWGRVTHICVSRVTRGILPKGRYLPCVSKVGRALLTGYHRTIIGSDNGLSPGQCQGIIWANAGILLIQTLGTNFSEFLKQNSNIFIQENAFERSSVKWRPICLSLNNGMLILKLLDSFFTKKFTLNSKLSSWLLIL